MGVYFIGVMSCPWVVAVVKVLVSLPLRAVSLFC